MPVSFPKRLSASRSGIGLLSAALAIVTPAGFSHAYNASGNVTTVAPSANILNVNGLQHRVSPQVAITFSDSDTAVSANLADLQTGEYIQFELKDRVITQIRRYRKGPPN